jgi:membrane protease YdiL (CAAX protease family)
MYQTHEIDLSWQENSLKTFLPVILALLFFVIYWFTAQSDKIKNNFYSRYDHDTASVKHIFFTKYFGFICMGIVPLIISMIAFENGPEAYGLTIIPETTLYSVVWTLGLSAVVAPLAYISAKKPKNLINYPQIRAKEWTRKTVLINALGWALYLFGYELLFRGTLLFPLVTEIGVWPAVAVNIALYSATHIPKGLDETIGAIPLGLVLCILTLQSGTIWIAFFVHLALAWTNCFTALKFHPDIHYIGSKK